MGKEGVTRFDGVLVEVDGALVEVAVEKPFSARDSRSRRRTADTESNLRSGIVISF